jgi:predicted O-methyltransferase YrrM
LDVAAFRKAFWTQFKGAERNAPCYAYWDPLVNLATDPCPDVIGMTAIRNQQLLNLAFRFIGEGECYLEVGTYQGKSLISAMLDNPPVPVFACDNFSEFEGNSLEVTKGNLRRYGLEDKVTFYNCGFIEIYCPEKLPIPVGLYFYDAGHEEEPQYLAIARIEPFLADEALVIVDDWCYRPELPFYAKKGTMRAIHESSHHWQLMYELPARFNTDRAMWWNGVGLLSFRRSRAERPAG